MDMVYLRLLVTLLVACRCWANDDAKDNPYSRDWWKTKTGDLTKLGTFTTKPSNDYNLMTVAGLTPHIGLLSDKKSAYEGRFNDPMWWKQWYFQDYRTVKSPVYDHNVVPVYKMNINGSGVVVGVVDSGIQSDNPDLKDNYVEELSYDFIKKRKGAKLSVWTNEEGVKQTESHGTWAAGVIAMVADNNVCGVGVAYGAKVTGLLTLGPKHITSYYDMMDSIAARALAHRLDKIDIYSNSWGFIRSGNSIKETPKLIYKAISKGVTLGRKGKGAIYVFASGNSRVSVEKESVVPLDNCATDALANNPHVIVISSANQWGRITHYGEACTNVMATAYSDGFQANDCLVSTDSNTGCTDKFGGTSGATAIASGILALVLSANQELTYRDMMHLIVAGSEVAPLAENEPTWYDNKAGFTVSNDFGFGLLNAENMVRLAKNWKRVPDKKVCVINVNVNAKVFFGMESSTAFFVDTDGCQKTGNGQDGVRFLEHVELATTIRSLTNVQRGDFSIFLTSPRGTKSRLLKPRAMDRSANGFKDWSVSSVHNWGEDPSGRWTIHVFIHDYAKTWPMLVNNQPKAEGATILQSPKAKSFNKGEESVQPIPQPAGIFSSFGLFSKKPSSEQPVKKEGTKDGGMSGVVKGFTLTLHGTNTKPPHYADEIPYRTYSSFRCYVDKIEEI